jgi:hypothetical protein
VPQVDGRHPARDHARRGFLSDLPPGVERHWLMLGRLSAEFLVHVRGLYRLWRPWLAGGGRHDGRVKAEGEN